MPKKFEPEVLLVTCVSDLAADALVLALQRREISFHRLNAEDLPAGCQISWSPTSPSILQTGDGRVVALNCVRGAWYRFSAEPLIEDSSALPGSSQFVRDETINFLEGIYATAEFAWMNRPSCVSQAQNKLIQLQAAVAIGLTVPNTVVTNNPNTVTAILSTCDRIVVKALSTARFDSGANSFALFSHALSRLTDEQYNGIKECPCIVQECVSAAFDLRVTVVGEQVFAAEIIQPRSSEFVVDWRRLDAQTVGYRRHKLDSSVRRYCIELVRYFGLNYSAIDFLVTEGGEYVFLELNPSGQWGWIENAVGFPITDSIVSSLISGELK